MLLLEIECPAEEKDLLIADLWERGTTGVVEEDLPGGRCLLRAFFEAAFNVSDLARWNPRWSEAPERDWVGEAQSQWAPVLVGERFFLVPEWSTDPTPPGRVRLEMQPGRACGTGWHPSTQLALEAMERYLVPGATVLDLGTGSGILAVGAARLGAGRVFACDIDPEAAAAARERFLREQVAVGLYTGSLRAVGTRAVDLLVANINAEALVYLSPQILRVLKPHGTAILTGFPDRHLARVEAVFTTVRQVMRNQEWAAVVGR